MIFCRHVIIIWSFQKISVRCSIPQHARHGGLFVQERSSPTVKQTLYARARGGILTGLSPPLTSYNKILYGQQPCSSCVSLLCLQNFCYSWCIILSEGIPCRTIIRIPSSSYLPLSDGIACEKKTSPTTNSWLLP